MNFYQMNRLLEEKHFVESWLNENHIEYNQEILNRLIQEGWGDKIRKGIGAAGMAAAMAGSALAPTQGPMNQYDVSASSMSQTRQAPTDAGMEKHGVMMSAHDSMKKQITTTISSLSKKPQIKINDQFISVIMQEGIGPEAGRKQALCEFSGTVFASSAQEAIQVAQSIIQQEMQSKGYNVENLEVDYQDGYSQQVSSDGTPIRPHHVDSDKASMYRTGIPQHVDGPVTNWKNMEYLELAGVLITEQNKQQFGFKAKLTISIANTNQQLVPK